MDVNSLLTFSISLRHYTKYAPPRVPVLCASLLCDEAWGGWGHSSCSQQQQQREEHYTLCLHTVHKVGWLQGGRHDTTSELTTEWDREGYEGHSRVIKFNCLSYNCLKSFDYTHCKIP